MDLLRDAWTLLKARPYLLIMPVTVILLMTGDLHRMARETLEKPQT